MICWAISLVNFVSANRAKSLIVKHLQQEKAQREKPFEGFKMVFYNGSTLHHGAAI
jgi:hypothetical protein